MSHDHITDRKLSSPRVTFSALSRFFRRHFTINFFIEPNDIFYSLLITVTQSSLADGLHDFPKAEVLQQWPCIHCRLLGPSLVVKCTAASSPGFPISSEEFKGPESPCLTLQGLGGSRGLGTKAVHPQGDGAFRGLQWCLPRVSSALQQCHSTVSIILPGF